jgi:hypothetical protein
MAHDEIQHEPGEEYVGTAEVLADDTTEPIVVDVHLRGHVEPIDGRFHWYGRIAAYDELASRHRPGTTVALRTPHGFAAGKIADVDPWGRFRITGLGTPPF